MELREMIRQIWPDWELVEKIGEGSFGTVYKAKREDLAGVSYSAIKVTVIPKDSSEIAELRAEGLSAGETRTYFEKIVRDYSNEIKMLESVKGYTNIVAIEDYKIWEHQSKPLWHIFIRMELLTTLTARIAGQGQLSETEIAKVGIDLCRALEVCSQHHIIHRDIKPENIFINANGDYKLGDFGVARSLERLTNGMTRRGTPNYMAPEVYRGTMQETSYEQAQLVDIYSVGMVLYWLANGSRMPFLPDNKQLATPEDRRNAFVRRMSGETLPPPKYVQGALADVILKASAYRAEDRYQSAKELRHALQYVVVAENDTLPDYLQVVKVRETPRTVAEEQEKTEVTPRIAPAKAGRTDEGIAVLQDREHGAEQAGEAEKNKENKSFSGQISDASITSTIQIEDRAVQSSTSESSRNPYGNGDKRKLWIGIAAMMVLLLGGFLISRVWKPETTSTTQVAKATNAVTSTPRVTATATPRKTATPTPKPTTTPRPTATPTPRKTATPLPTVTSTTKPTVAPTMVPHLTISKQPEDIYAAVGQTVTLSASVTGASNYQWQFRYGNNGTWINLSSAHSWVKSVNTDTLKIVMTKSVSVYEYRLLAYDDNDNCVETNAAKVYLDTTEAKTSYSFTDLQITRQPMDARAVNGSSVTISATVEGASSYQWQFRYGDNGSWINLSSVHTWVKGVYTDMLTITVTQSVSAYEYRLLAYDKNESQSVATDAVRVYVSNTATATPHRTATPTPRPTATPTPKRTATPKPTVTGSSPVIKVQPKNMSVAFDSEAVLSIKAENATNYQWMYNDGNEWQNLDSANQSEVSVCLKLQYINRQYCCMVTGLNGAQVKSDIVQITPSNVYGFDCSYAHFKELAQQLLDDAPTWASLSDAPHSLIAFPLLPSQEIRQKYFFSRKNEIEPYSTTKGSDYIVKWWYFTLPTYENGWIYEDDHLGFCEQTESSADGNEIIWFQSGNMITWNVVPTWNKYLIYIDSNGSSTHLVFDLETGDCIDISQW